MLFILAFGFLNGYPYQKQIGEYLLAKAETGPFSLAVAATKNTLADS